MTGQPNAHARFPRAIERRAPWRRPAEPDVFPARTRTRGTPPLGREDRRTGTGTGRTETAVIRGIDARAPRDERGAFLSLAFTALASGPGTEPEMLATALAVGILLDATVIRALIVPAVISLMGRWNWWLPPGRRGCCAYHPRSRRDRPVALTDRDRGPHSRRRRTRQNGLTRE